MERDLLQVSVKRKCFLCCQSTHTSPIIELQLPSFFNNFDPHAAAANFPSGVQAYLAGLTFALVASPCSTPVLATLLGYIAESKDGVNILAVNYGSPGACPYPRQLKLAAAVNTSPRGKKLTQLAKLKCLESVSGLPYWGGIYGYPIEIQALFFFALRCAQQMLKPEGGGKELIERIDKRITALSFHIQNWLDFTQLN
ncbi:unnamed protein product [Camellia sinensis]